MISFDERCYSNQYDEISDEEFSDDEFSDDEISGFINTTKFLTTKFLTTKFLATKFPPPQFRIFSRKNYIVRFEMFGRIFLSKLFLNQKIISGWKIQKTKKWCFGNRSRPMKWAHETLISQWYLFICFLSACYVASSRITTVHRPTQSWLEHAEWTMTSNGKWIYLAY